MRTELEYVQKYSRNNLNVVYPFIIMANCGRGKKRAGKFEFFKSSFSTNSAIGLWVDHIWTRGKGEVRLPHPLNDFIPHPTKKCYLTPWNQTLLFVTK